MRYTLNYQPGITQCVQPYNTIIQDGYYAIKPDLSNNQVMVEDITYNLTKIWFDCEKDTMNQRELHISSVYFEHTEVKPDRKDTSSSNKMVYIKIPIIVDASNTSTYKHIRKFINDINESDMKHNSNIKLSISDTIFNAAESTVPVKTLNKLITNTFTFSNKTSSGTNVGYIVELAPMNVPVVCKFTVNDDAFDISLFINTNVSTKNTPNNPNNNNVITSHKDADAFEGFSGIESFVEGLTCKRKANTGIINGTVMSRDFADKLIEAQTQIGITTIVMFFVSLFVITIGYLMAKSYEDYDIVIPESVIGPPAGGGRRTFKSGGGGMCDLNDANLFTGYILIFGISCFTLNMYGAMQLKEMYMMTLAFICILSTIAYYMYFGNGFSIYDIELEHLILYNRKKPFVKWVAISAYYVFFSLFFTVLTNPKLTTTSFYMTQFLFIILTGVSYMLYKNYANIFMFIATKANPIGIGAKVDFVTNILNQLQHSIINVPLIMVGGVSVITNLLLII